MAGGKHSAGKKDRFFGDWKKRHEDEFFEEGTNDREELDINEFNKFKESIKNYKEEKKEEAFKPNFDYDDNREETKNDYDEEDDDSDNYEEDSFVSGLNKATTAVKILIVVTAIVVIIGGIFVVRKIFSPKPEEHVARDFILRVEISSSTAPTVTFTGVDEQLQYDSDDNDWAVLEPGLNFISFTETK